MPASPRVARAPRPVVFPLRLAIVAQCLLGMLLCLGGMHPALAGSLADAFDQPELTVTTSGAAGWFAQTLVTHDGSDALQAGSIQSGESSSVSVTVSGAASISFRWKVSSESGYDFLRFFIDGVDQGNPLGGEVDWQRRSSDLTPDAHTLVWSYIKDGSASSGLDSAWLDELSILPNVATTPPVIEGLTTRLFPSDESAVMQVGATGGDLSYRWHRGAPGDTAQPVEGATGPCLIAPAGPRETIFWVRVSNSLGSVDSGQATVPPSSPSRQDLRGMGSSRLGQLGIGVGFGVPLPIPSLSGIAQVAAGEAHTLFIKTDGSLWGMGYNGSGQLGDDSTPWHTIPVPIATDVVQVAAGSSSTLFVKADGSLWAMGSGRFGNGSHFSDTPVRMASDVAGVSAGNAHFLFVKTDGTLWAMGTNDQGQLGDGASSHRDAPVQITTGVSRVAAGAFHSLFIKTDGTLWAMGANGAGQLGDGSMSPSRDTPVPIAADVAKIAAGDHHSLFIKTDGSLWAMGANDFGQLGDGSTLSRRAPVQVALAVTQISARASYSLFVKNDASLWASGYNDYGQLGDTSHAPYHRTPVQVAADVARVAAGGHHSVFIKADHSLWGTGYNIHGQLGETLPHHRTRPTAITTDVVRIAAGDSHTLFVKTDQTLWAMGGNDHGQLGDGSAAYQASPILIATDVIQIAAGGSHSVFIKTDGTLWAMGANEWGQLGDGSGVSRHTPTWIASHVIRIAAGRNHTLFIKADGSLWGMGANGIGQLGDNSYSDRMAPVPVATDVVKIAAGGNFSLFIKNDASLWATGDSFYGQLGQAPFSHLRSPVRIATGVTHIAAGDSHGLFIKNDASLWGLGNGGGGQLGLNTGGNNPSPIWIAADVVEVAAGGSHTLFIKADTSLWSTGHDDYGQLGQGPGLNYYRVVPAQIATGTLSVAAGYSHSIFLQTPTHAVTFVLGDHGTRGGGGDLVQTVTEGKAAVAPFVFASSPGWVFHGWDTAFDVIHGDLTVHAVYRREQTISFTIPPGQIFRPTRSNQLTLTASSSSGLPVMLDVVSGPASVDADGRTILLHDAGTIVLRALQSGDDTWAAAVPVERSVVVKAIGRPQKITFPQPAAKTYGDGPFSLRASASSSLPVTFELISGPAFLQDDTLTVTDVGRVVVRASQPGGNGFGAAPDVTRDLIVRKAPLTVLAGDATRLIGEPNPEFSLTYSGFVGPDSDDEAAAVAGLDRLPVARTRAGRKSPQGDYPITISGGADDRYEFIPAHPPGMLSVLGFGGTYEALLVDPDDDAVLIGKLTLKIPANSFSYTGVLHLAREPRALAVSSTSRVEGTTPFVAAENRASASATWNHAVTGFDSLALVVGADGSLTGTLERNARLVGILAHGHRLYMPVAGSEPPRAPGRLTLVLHPAIPSVESESPLPSGFGHASVSISPRTGSLSLSGKLADGSPVTAALTPGESGACLLWTNPYGTRIHSFLAGLLAGHADDSFLVWKKAALPESSPVATRDKSYRAGFGPVELPLSLDPWLPPVPPSAAGPAATLPARLGLVANEAGRANVRVHHAPYHELGQSVIALPALATLSIGGKLVAATPNTTRWKITALDPATGAFSGGFVLADPAPTDADPRKATRRSVSFSGTLRQRDAEDPDDTLVGAGFFLLPALPGSESDERISGELRFTVP